MISPKSSRNEPTIKTSSHFLRLLLIICLFILNENNIIQPRPGEVARAAQASFTEYQWSTFFGNGGGVDYPADVISDGSGNAYILGLSSSPWEGPGGQPARHAHNRQHTNLVVIKLSNGAYQWHTFFGSSDIRKSIAATGLALDPEGNLLVTGTSGDWLGPDGEFPVHYFSGNDYASEQFVLKLTSSGDYVWHTYFPAIESGGIAADIHGDVFVVGSNSIWSIFPEYIPLHGSELDGVNFQIIKLNKNGQYLWHTYYGSGLFGSFTYANDTAIDADGTLYVIGESPGIWQGDGMSAPLNEFTGGRDLTILKLTSGGAYLWHTFYGSIDEETANSIVVDNSGGVYLAGGGPQIWNGPDGEAPLYSLGSAYLLKLAATGDYQWHTFCSMSLDPDLAWDGLGGLYLTGFSWTVISGPGGQPPLNETAGMVAIKYNQEGAYLWHTQYPASSNYRIFVAAREDGHVHLVGYGYSNWDGPDGQVALNAYTENDIFSLDINNNGSYHGHSFWGAWSDIQGKVEMASDPAGNVYLVGVSNNNWPGPAGEQPLIPHPAPGRGSIAIVKLSQAGAYQWHTFFGDSFDVNGIGDFLVGLDGSLYIAGNSLSWLGPAGQVPLHSHSQASASDKDSFLLKLDGTGHYLWHTFYGADSYVPQHGHGEDGIHTITQADNGDLYLAGGSFSAWYGPGGELPLHAFSLNGYYNIFVLVLSQAGNYSWHTFYGSVTDHSNAGQIIINSGEIFINGTSNATWNGPAEEAPLHSFSPGLYGSEAFILKLSANGVYRWHTFYGATDDGDMAHALVADSAGDIYVVGESYGEWYGDDYAIPLNFHSGGEDLFVLKLTSDGAYQWHTFYGSAGNIVNGESVQFDPAGSIYIAGSSLSEWNGPQGQLPINPFSPGFDIYVLSLDDQGNYNWHTFFGEDLFGEIEMSFRINDGIYLAGIDHYGRFPPDDQIPLHPPSGGLDFFAMKLGEGGVVNPPEWTLMVYLATDNDLERDLFWGSQIMNNLEAAANNPVANIIVFWDRDKEGDAAYYEVQFDRNASILGFYEEGINLWSKDEPNMGDPSSLISFVDWAKINFPANHYALILTDHGSGLGGAMYDDSSDDHLTVKELGDAVQAISNQGQNPLDIVFMYACLMGMLEDAYQFRGTTQYYIASQNQGWTASDPFFHFVYSLVAGMTPEQYAIQMAQVYTSGVMKGKKSYTISVADLQQLDLLVNATNRFAQVLDANMATSSDMITGLAQAAQRFDEDGNDVIDFKDTYMDLFHFASMFSLNTTNPEIQNAAEELKDAIGTYIIFNDRQSFENSYPLNMSHGVSIFFPVNSSSFYNPDNYDFAAGADWSSQGAMDGMMADASWGSMLVDYFQFTQPDGLDDPTPPEVRPLLSFPNYQIHLPLILQD